MKNRILSCIGILAVSMIFVSCGTLFTAGGSDYRSAVTFHSGGDYVKAIDSLEKALTANPEFTEALELYPVVFKEGTSFYKNEVQNYESKDDRQSADRVYHAYKNLHAMHSLASSGNRSFVAVEDFSSQVEASRKEAGQQWFSWGQNHFAQGGRDRFKQAVNAFETAKSRDPQIDEIDQWIKDAFDQAAITLMVLGIGSDEAFHTMVLNDIKKTFASDRFVQVVETGNFMDNGGMAGPTDLAIHHGMANNIDYLIEIYVNHQNEPISKRERVRLPSSQPLFDGEKVSTGFTAKNDVTYRVFTLDQVGVIAEDSFSLVDGPFLHEYSFVKAEGLRELSLDGAKSENLRYVNSHADLGTTDQAIRVLRQYNAKLNIPSDVPTGMLHTGGYFKDRYDSFYDFISKTSGIEMFYGIEIVHHPQSDSYYFVHTTIDPGDRTMAAAKEASQRNSNIMNALGPMARTLASRERGPSYFKVGEEVGKRIKPLF